MSPCVKKTHETQGDTMIYASIKEGYWGQQVLKNVEFPLAKTWTKGSKGWYVTVNGSGKNGFPDRNFRIFTRGPGQGVEFYKIENNDKIIVKANEVPSGHLILDTRPTIPGFITGNDDVETSSFLNDVENVIPEEIPETDEEISNRINERFNILKDQTIASTFGLNRGMVITGAPGVGKSYEVVDALKKQNVYDKMTFDPSSIVMENEDLDLDDGSMPESPGWYEFDSDGKKIIKYHTYHVVKGHMSPAALYSTLYGNRQENEVLIFDDCDSVLMDEESLQLLKAALDTTSDRIISWVTNSSDMPSQFLYEGSIMFISNINFEKTVNSGRSKIGPHLEAIMDRCLYLDLTIDSSREKLIRIKYVSKECGLFDREELNKEQGEEILSWIEDNLEKFRTLSLRKVIQLCNLYKSTNNWKRSAEVLLLKN